MLESLVGTVFGGLITLAVAWVFYRAASRDLEEKARRLQRTVNALGGAIEMLDPDRQVKFVRDDEGNITGRLVELGPIEATISLSTSVELSVTRQEEQTEK